jgi:hypothetical protein
MSLEPATLSVVATMVATDDLSFDVDGLNSDCSYTKMLLMLICCISLSYMIFSNTLENDGNRDIGL